MIFQHTWEQVLGIEPPLKTQTRRLASPFDRLGRHDHGVSMVETVMRRWRTEGWERRTRWGIWWPKWIVGHIYAVQPGRGQKAVGRIRITAVRKERLQIITPEDIWDEGIRLADLGDFDPLDSGAPDIYDAFRILWNSIHAKSGTRWVDNPEVFALSFEPVERSRE